MNTKMNKYQKILGSIFLGSILIFSLVAVSSAAKENGYYEDHDSDCGKRSHGSWNRLVGGRAV